MRLPLRMPAGRLTPEGFDALLAEGDRRSGPLLYRPNCPSCTACEAIRVPVARFEPTRSQRRAVKKNPDIRIERHRATVTAAHLDLYNRHSRQLSHQNNANKNLHNDAHWMPRKVIIIIIIIIIR